MQSLLKLKPIAAVALVIAGITLNYASSQAQPHAWPYGGAERERFIPKMMQRLHLSESQKQQIKAILAQAREKMRPQRELVMSERIKLYELIQADNPDPNAIRAQTQRLASYEAELNVLRAEERKKVEAILTPKQLNEWKKMRLERREKMRKHQKQRKEWIEER
jgi:Spy/CpxP family protein refolding chaperone